MSHDTLIDRDFELTYTSFLLCPLLAGYAYCAVGALYMLDRPPSSTPPHGSPAIERGVPDRTALIRFLVHRQFNYLVQQEEDADSSEDKENFVETGLGTMTLEDGCTHVGWNGRWNKKADTCYCWWVAGTLSVRYFGPRLSVDPLIHLALTDGLV